MHVKANASKYLLFIMMECSRTDSIATQVSGNT